MDLDTRLAAASPASRASLDGPDSPAAISLYQRITTPPAAPAQGRRSPVPHRAGRRFLLSATGVVTAAVTVTVALATLPGSPMAPLPASAAALDRAAIAAANQPSTSPGPGQSFYLKTIATVGVASVAPLFGGHPGYEISSSLFGNVSGPGLRRCTMISQLWVTSDGAGRRVWTPQPGQPGTGTPACHAYAQTFPGNTSGVNPFPPVVRGNLPLRPAALEAVIAHRYADGKPDITTFYAASVLLVDDQSPALRAALYRVIERLPSITDLGPARDLLGRDGIAVGFTESGVRDELIFDPATSAVLETRSVAVTAQPRQCIPAQRIHLPAMTVHGHHVPPQMLPVKRSCAAAVPAGTELGYTVFLTSGVVPTPAADRGAAQ